VLKDNLNKMFLHSYHLQYETNGYHWHEVKSTDLLFKAQIKRRTGGGGPGAGENTAEDKGREETDNHSKEVVPSPSQLSRSPRPASLLAGAALVLPPLGGKDGGYVQRIITHFQRLSESHKRRGDSRKCVSENYQTTDSVCPSVPSPRRRGYKS